MNFNDRNHYSRKSDPTYKNKKLKEPPSTDDMDSVQNIKRRGTSLARPDLNRQNSLGNSGRASNLKRISVLETGKTESSTPSGGMKIMNFIKSSLNLTKTKSKSKLNLNENRQSLYTQTSTSKSEENLNFFKNDVYYQSIKSSSLVLKPKDRTLYEKEYNSNNEEILKSLLVLDKNCVIQPLHPSIANYQNFYFQILKREPVIDLNKSFVTCDSTKNSLQVSQIAKSLSYNSSFCSLKSSQNDSEFISTIRCGSAAETNEWINKLKNHINPHYEKRIRHEDFFKIWIQEAKNLILKKRYYCEIKLDNMLYGRTTVKTMTEMVFWGEEFEFRGLQNISTISISLFRMTDNKKKHDKSELIAQINVPCSDFTESSFVEKWYSPSPDIRLSSTNLRFSQSAKIPNSSRPEYDELMKSVIDCSPMLRIKGRYRPLEILPTRFYQPFADFLVKESLPLVESLESHLKVKSKEDFVTILLLVLEHKECHLDFLSDLVTLEVSKAVQDNLILRGNSIASKAMECYLKMIGEKYLPTLLRELINEVIQDEIDCEVDPIRLSNPKDLNLITENQNKLLRLVESIWNKIYTTAHLVPKDLKSVFSKIREKLSETKCVSYSSPMIDQVISSCLFLRFICPAIMSPFLFGLSNEYSDKLCVNRTFTLVAKCIQSLANFSQFHQCKEDYMIFMQNFINKNSNNMRTFLRQISTFKSNGIKTSDSLSLSNAESLVDHSNCLTKGNRFIDIGYQLAELSFQLNIHLLDIPEKEYTVTLRDIRSVLKNISTTAFNVESECDSSSSNISNVEISQSRIPTLVTKSDRIPIEVRNNKNSPEKSISDNQKNINVKRKFSFAKKKPDVEENFSYIPVRNSHSKGGSVDKKNQLSNDNYVDFEHCESVIYDDPYSENSSSRKASFNTKCLNEEEINDDWRKMVRECHRTTANYIGPATEDPSNYTFNSSGYQSLSNFSPDDLEKSIVQPQNRYETFNNENLNNQIASSLPARVSSPKRQPNIIKRIKKNSPLTSKASRLSTDGQVSETNNSQSPQSNWFNEISGNLSFSRETLESIENISESDNRSLSGSKSMLCLHLKKSSGSNSNLASSNCDKYFSESRDASDGSLPSRNRLPTSNLQSISSSISISTNIDLDPLISNEGRRIKLLLELFDINKPSVYHGDAIEQYRQKTIDENTLSSFLEKKSQINQSDIISYLPAAYRLLKGIHKHGQITPEILTKYLLEANRRIQTDFINHNLQEQNYVMPNSSDSKSAKTTHSKNYKSSRDSSKLSTQSLPFPLTKYSKQSQKPDTINKL